MSQRNANGKSGASRQNKAKGRSSMNRPPQLNSNVIVNHVFRFSADSTGVVNYAVTVENLLGICGGIATVSNTTVSGIADSVRLHSLKIWSPPSAQGASTTCSVEWAPSNFSPTTEVSDTSMSVTTPACVIAVPPQGSQASFWNSSVASANTICQITAPAGSVIDAHVSFILCDKASASPTYTVATAVLGELYYLALDQTGSSHLVPTSLNTTK